MSDAIVTASAPGKAVLCGEYAVLDGAPAICMAVDARARVTIEPTTADYHAVVAPGYCERVTRFRDSGGRLEWLDDGRPFDLLQQVWHLSAPLPAGGLALTLDTADFLAPAGDAKTGLGSSAALAVALAAALHALQAGGDPLDAAHRAHLALQGGRGSGVDVACSAAGGLIEYCMEGRRTRRLEWPAGLEYRLLYSGVAARTDVQIAHYEKRGSKRAKTKFREAAARMADAWRRASAADILDEYRAYTSALEIFSVDHDLGIFDAGHAELVAAAGANGLVYKPCGSGGGDVGIAFGSDALAIDDFIAGGLPAGFEVLAVGIDSRGIDVDNSSQ